MPKKYVSKKYEDFSEFNHVWCFDVLDSNYKFIKLNNLCAGDTDSGYFDISDKLSDYNIDEIVDVSDDLVEVVDQKFPDFLRLAFNCPEDRLRSVRTEREVVSDRSFFVTKKRYAMHIVDDEGKRVDKMKITGLEVKKSDTSKSAKRFLRKCIDMIIDGCTREELLAYKNEFKKEFFTLGISEIGVPMPAKKLTKYKNEYDASGSMKGFPYHYRAALFYNGLCGQEDREIYAGEKFYVCNIKNPDSKYMAIPVALNKMPSFIDDVIVDYEAMWKKTDKKISNYMESLGWDLKSRMDNQAASLFGV